MLNLVCSSIKKCKVCGDKAVAFNFEGLSCESCKAFFRRNSQLFEKLKCENNRDCEITPSDRRKCKKCRMDKCIEIGMRLDLINNRIRKANQKLKPQDRLIEAAIESCIHNFAEPFDSIESSTMPNQQTNKSYEQTCLELVRKSKYLFHEPSQMDQINVIGFVGSMTQVLCNQQHLIHDIISFANSIPGFVQLKSAQQLITFRGAFSRILLLRTAYYFDISKNCFIQRIDPKGEAASYVNLDIVYGMEDNKNAAAIEQHRMVAYMVKEEIQQDHVIRDLLSAILMFNNKTNNPDNLEYARYQYILHCQLLQKYLLVKNENNNQIVSRKFMKLMKIIDEIEVIEQNVQSVLLSSKNIEIGQIPHVLCEIYRLT